MAGAPGAIERGVPAARAVGTLSPGDPGKFVVVVVGGGGGGGGERWGAGSPREVESPTPVAKSRRGGRGAGASGGRGSTRHRAVHGKGGVRRGSANACHGSIWECCSGGDRRHSSVRRTLEKEEARLLHLEVSSRSSRRSGFEGLELSFLSSCSQGGTDRPRPRAYDNPPRKIPYYHLRPIHFGH
jgi:hypothetical protein